MKKYVQLMSTDLPGILIIPLGLSLAAMRISAAGSAPMPISSRVPDLPTRRRIHRIGRLTSMPRWPLRRTKEISAAP